MRNKFKINEFEIKVIKVMNYINNKIIQIEIKNILEEQVEFDIEKLNLQNAKILKGYELKQNVYNKFYLLNELNNSKREFSKDIEKEISEKNDIIIKEKAKIKKNKKEKIQVGETINYIVVCSFSNYATNNYNFSYDGEEEKVTIQTKN